MKNLLNNLIFRDKAPGNSAPLRGRLLFLLAGMFLVWGFQPAQAVVSEWTSIPSPLDSGCDISLVVSGSLTASSSEPIQDQTFTGDLTLGGSTTTSSSSSLIEASSTSSTETDPAFDKVALALDLPATNSTVPDSSSNFAPTDPFFDMGNIVLFPTDSVSALDSSNINMLEIIAVPEPSMWGLASAGFAVLLLTRKMLGNRTAWQIG
jgi:hypothetical protein